MIQRVFDVMEIRFGAPEGLVAELAREATMVEACVVAVPVEFVAVVAVREPSKKEGLILGTNYPIGQNISLVYP